MHLATKKTYLLDGPMGTELDRYGSDTSLPLWSARALLENPEMVLQIHNDFIQAGADIITTDTFRTIEWTLQKAGLSGPKAKELTFLAVSLAKESRQKTGKCLIAGSIAPLEDCYSPDLVPPESILMREHKKLISQLAEAGVDVFLVETMNSFREAKAAYKITTEYPDISVIVSFTCDNKGQILSGDSWKNVCEFFKDKVDVLAVNCSSLNGTSQAIRELRQNNVSNWGAYPNFGSVTKDKWSRNIDNEYIHKSLHEWIDLQPKVIGTCCGAVPADTKRIHNYLL